MPAWLLNEHTYYLVDVMRIRVDYPTLKERMIAFAKVHKPSKILIEDCGVGTALIPELKATGHSVIAVKPERDKKTRLSVKSAKFESGQVYFPERAPWLAELEARAVFLPAVATRRSGRRHQPSARERKIRLRYNDELGWMRVCGQRSRWAEQEQGIGLLQMRFLGGELTPTSRSTPMCG